MSFPVAPSVGDDYTTALRFGYRYETDRWDYRGVAIAGGLGATGPQGVTGINGVTGITGVGTSADGTNLPFVDAFGVTQHCSPDTAHANLVHNIGTGTNYSVSANTWTVTTAAVADKTSLLAIPSTANDNITFVTGADGIYKIGMAFTMARADTASLVDMGGVFVDGTLVLQSVWQQGTGHWYAHNAERLIALTKDSTVQHRIYCSAAKTMSYYAGGPAATGAMPVSLYVMRIDR